MLRTLNKLEEDIELLRQEERTYSETWQTRKLAFDGIVTSLEAMQEAIRCVLRHRRSDACFCLPPPTLNKRGWLTHRNVCGNETHRDEKAEQERRRALDEEDDAGGGGSGGGGGGSGAPGGGGGGPPPAPGSIDTGDANNTPRAGSLDPNAKPFVPGGGGPSDDDEDVEMRYDEGEQEQEQEVIGADADREMDRGRISGEEEEERRDRDLGEREEGQMTDEREEGEM